MKLRIAKKIWKERTIHKLLLFMSCYGGCPMPKPSRWKPQTIRTARHRCYRAKLKMTGSAHRVQA